MKLKWSESYENRKKILRKSRGSISTFIVFLMAENQYFVVIAFKMLKIQIHVYSINNERVSHFSQFNLVKVKKNLRKSQAQFREKLRNLRLRQNYSFLIKKLVLDLWMTVANTRKLSLEIIEDLRKFSAWLSHMAKANIHSDQLFPILID